MSAPVRPEVVACLEGILGSLAAFVGFAHPTEEEYAAAERHAGLAAPTATAATADDRHLRVVSTRP